MTRAKLPATIVAIATYIIVAGIFTQSGVVLEPAAAAFHASLPDTAVLFSYASAGNLGGIIVSLVAFNLFSIRTVLVAAYLCLFAGVGTIVATHALAVANAAIFAVGLGVGTGLSAGAVILAKLYAGRARAVAFLCTDCAFSASGFVLPAVAGAAIAAHGPWWSGYVVVAALALLVLAAALRLPFPATGRAERAQRGTATSEAAPRGAYLRIGLISAGLALYLTGQTSFTIWAPAVLEHVLGVHAAEAGTIVSSFFGPSSLGLVTAALVVSRLAPRVVLCFALVMGVVLTFALATLTDARAFFIATFAFGFTTTCMFKLMISIGSEQLPTAPSPLVTWLLIASSIGTTAAPVVSAAVVRAFGDHASLWLTWSCYTATLVTIAAALLLESAARRASARLAATPA